MRTMSAVTCHIKVAVPHCYSSSSSLLFLLLSAPCIIHHTQSRESSSECNSLLHSAQIFCYSKQKSAKDLDTGQETKNIEIHMDHHSFVRSFTMRRTKLKRKSPDKPEQCLGDEEETIAYVSAGTPLMSHPTSWPVLASTSTVT